MPRVYVKTLGCKVNTFDSHALANRFVAAGYELLMTPAGADVTVVNTCSVTANADKEARYLARRIRRDTPETLLVFTGCYAQTDSARLVAMPEIDFVVPNEVKDALVGLVGDVAARRKIGDIAPKLPAGTSVVTENRQSHFKSAVTLFDKADSAQTRTFVKIQDGCDGFCSYCLIPYARGQSRSVPSAAVVAEIARLTDAGSAEIVLTGIHIGDYGRDLDEYAGVEHPIVLLLERLFALPNLKRLRISSLEPAELSSELVACLAAHKHQVCDHLHLPLQSGSDRILKAMRRQYTTAEYAASVTEFRTAFPNASIGADVIPGFPGETEEDFQATLALIKGLKLSYLHVFPYSKRPNTAAARMPGHLDGELVKTRASQLRQLSSALQADYAHQHIGQTKEVIWEKDQDESGRQIGITSNYLNVVAPRGADATPGMLAQVELKGLVEQGRLLARPVDLPA